VNIEALDAGFDVDQTVLPGERSAGERPRRRWEDDGATAVCHTPAFIAAIASMTASGS